MKGERPPWLYAHGPGRQPGGAGGPDAASPSGSSLGSPSFWAPLSSIVLCRVGVRAPLEYPPPRISSNRSYHNDTEHLYGESHLWTRRPSLKRSVRATQTKSGGNFGEDFTSHFGGGGVGLGGACVSRRQFACRPQCSRLFCPPDPCKGQNKA